MSTPSLLAPATNSFSFISAEHKTNHTVAPGAPCEWSLKQGATHALLLFPRGFATTTEVNGLEWETRPVKIAKTRIYVGVDEDEAGGIVWETWTGRWEANLAGEKPF